MNRPRHRLRIQVGPERIVLADGLQPFIFRSRRGTMFLQAQFTAPPGFSPKRRSTIPGYGNFGNVLSRDDGRTWQRWLPKEWKKDAPFFEGAFTELPDGTILLLEWTAVPTARPGVFLTHLWESKDDLKSFKGPIRASIRLPQAKTGGFDDGGHPYTGITFHRTMLALPNGDLLSAIYCWFKGDNTPCPYQPKMHKFRCVLLRSTDRGRHWDYVSTIAVNPAVGQEGFNESAMVRISEGPNAGRLVVVMRTGGTDCPLYQATSDDEGMTWSKPRKLPFCGVDPDLIEMADGTLVCSFGWRTKNWRARKPPKRLGNYVVFSRDLGQTWTNLIRLPIEPHANCPWTTCYTSVREIAARTLFVAYDVGRWGQPVRYIASRKVLVTAR